MSPTWLLALAVLLIVAACIIGIPWLIHVTGDCQSLIAGCK